MLSNFRAFAKSPAAAVLIGLLIVAFGVFGIRDVFGNKVAADAVVTAGDRTLTAADFKREFDSFKSRLEQQYRQPISMEAVAANALDKRALDGMASQEAVAAFLTKIRIRPSDKLVAAEIGKFPAFFDQVSGKFDKATYAQRLQTANLTPQKFESKIADDIAQQQFASGLAGGLRAPRAYSALAAIYGLESRDIAYFALPASSVPQPAAPTDEQLKAFMQEPANAAQLTVPETRTLTVVRFSPTLVDSKGPVDPAELKKRFDFKKDTLSTPETRTIVQIPAKTPAAAKTASDRLAKGEDPAAVAKSLGVDAITYAAKPQSAIADRKLAAGAFAMKAGDVSVVTGDLGAAAVKVISVTPGHPVTLEEARPALEAEIRKDMAAQKVYAMTQAYDEAHQAGSNLAQAAAKAGAQAQTVGPVTAQGVDTKGQPNPLLTPKIVETAFSLPAGGESELEDAGGGEYYAVRVEKIAPPALRSLDEVRPQVARAYTMRIVAKALQAKGDGLLARIKKGETLEAVAASTGASVVKVAGVSRQNARQHTDLSPDLLGKAFNSKPGDVFAADATTFGLVIGRLDGVSAGDVAAQAQITEQARMGMSQVIFREMGQSAEASARAKIKPVVNLAKARSAIGLEPETPADAKTAPAKKPGLAQ